MTRYLRSTIFLILIATFSAIAYADATFSLIRPSNVAEGRRFSLTFRLANGEANTPKAPQLEGCQLLYGPSVSTMQSTQIVNGQMKSSSSVDYSFIYMAEKAGQVKVPAVSVKCRWQDSLVKPGYVHHPSGRQGIIFCSTRRSTTATPPSACRRCIDTNTRQDFGK